MRDETVKKEVVDNSEEAVKKRGYIILPGGYKYAPSHAKDPYDPSKPLAR